MSPNVDLATLNTHAEETAPVYLTLTYNVFDYVWTVAFGTKLDNVNVLKVP